MRNCKKCQKPIPYRVKIDGKIKVTNNRVYCLECSPFGSHNTKQIHVDMGISGERICVCETCKRSYIFSRKKGNSSKQCKSCYTKNRRKEFKEFAIKIKGGKCICCGYDKCFSSLDFHHLNPDEKEFGISGNNFSKKRIEKELEKCILVCKNCHGEIESGLRTISGVVA
jgi:hypothetical protein